MKFAACLLALAVAGCPDTKTDPNDSGLPTVEFDPSHAVQPFPNDIVLCVTGIDTTGAPCTIGKIAIPAAACESDTSKAIRTNVLGQLDGFGTFEAAMQVTFTEEVDASTLDGHIVMYQRTKGATPNDPASAQPIPVTLIKGTTLRFTAATCTSPAVVNAVTIVPDIVLDQKSTYTVAVLAGVKTATGADYLPSATWSLVRQPVDPVTVDMQGNIVSESTPLTPGGDANGNGIPDTQELLGLDGLWKLHAPAMTFLKALGNDSTNVLVAWEVTTQTTTDPLDPAVAGSPAAALPNTGFAGLQSIVCNLGPTCPNGIDRTAVPYVLCGGGDSNTLCFLEIALGSASGATGAAIYTTGQGICTQVGCAAIGDILGGVIVSENYQVGTPNPLAGGAAVPGAWSDPIAPSGQNLSQLQTVVFIPATPMPAGGYPTLVFGHGLASSKSALFAFAPQLAASPVHFASMAIDFVNHGSRAIRTSNTGTDCADTGNVPPDPGDFPECYAPIFSADLAATRDNIRQTVLDLQRVIRVAKFCGSNACTSATAGGSSATPSTLKVDPAHIVYGGQSLGGIIGSTTSATAPDIKTSLLNVPAIGLLDVLEHTDTLFIRCQLVDALIDAGVLVGAKSDTATPLCADESWQAQPGYQQFAGVARWVLDPADGANFMSRLASKTILIQEVVDDQVVPNYATDIEGALAGLTPDNADPAVSASPSPSAAITTMPTASKWVRYPTLPADAASGFPGNLFEHPSLLRPSAGVAGQLGTIRLQTDAITFLGINH
ncbi:MAG: hypothetical protein ABI591_18245 [Kofleriaceae bacterium]